MIKKHLIACSVILLLMLSAKIYVGRSRKAAAPINSFPQTVDFPSPQEQKASSPQPGLRFANEKVPLSNKKVALKMKRYLKAHSFKHIQTEKLHHQAARWFPVIEPILKRHGIPEDFKYVPLVESGLMGGTSHKGASGYWQFMPQTARNYGLKVNRHIDERQDIRKSTIAACRYLKSLYKEFNNWTLVAAAYNVGENSLRQQISAQGHSNYFRMKLNRETASYVYKLVSMKEVIENPVKYGFAAKKDLLAKKEEKEQQFRFPGDHSTIETFLPLQAEAL